MIDLNKALRDLHGGYQIQKAYYEGAMGAVQAIIKVLNEERIKYEQAQSEGKPQEKEPAKEETPKNSGSHRPQPKGNGNGHSFEVG